MPKNGSFSFKILFTDFLPIDIVTFEYADKTDSKNVIYLSDVKYSNFFWKSSSVSLCVQHICRFVAFIFENLIKSNVYYHFHQNMLHQLRNYYMLMTGGRAKTRGRDIDNIIASYQNIQNPTSFDYIYRIY